VRHILDAVREVARKKLLFLAHAIKQMARPTTMISGSEVERVVIEGEIIEEVPLRRSVAYLFRYRELSL